MKYNKLQNRVHPIEDCEMLRLPKHTFEQIDYQLDNFFLGLKLYSKDNADGLLYMLESFYQLAFCEDDFDEFVKKAVDKYMIDIDSKVVEKLCNKEK
jgi:hypothetical protein